MMVKHGLSWQTESFTHLQHIKRDFMRLLIKADWQNSKHQENNLAIFHF
jgi:hypothetical protein